MRRPFTPRPSATSRHGHLLGERREAIDQHLLGQAIDRVDDVARLLARHRRQLVGRRARARRDHLGADRLVNRLDGDQQSGFVAQAWRHARTLAARGGRGKARARGAEFKRQPGNSFVPTSRCPPVKTVGRGVDVVGIGRQLAHGGIVLQQRIGARRAAARSQRLAPQHGAHRLQALASRRVLDEIREAEDPATSLPRR